MDFINTKISTLGPSRLDGVHMVYDYIEVIDNGQAVKIDNVIAANAVDAGLTAGAIASFYILELPINPNAKFLFALEVDGIKRVDPTIREAIKPPSFGMKALKSVLISDSYPVCLFWLLFNVLWGIPAILVFITKCAGTKKENENHEKALAVIGKAEAAGFRI